MHTQGRREFLQGIACLGGAVIGGGLRSAHAQGVSFAGVAAGNQREVDSVRLRWCPPGRFTMGSPDAERGRRSDEAQVDVRLSRGFWVGTLEVTQGQWQRVAGAFPDRAPSDEFGLGDKFPMYWVNYDEAELFCARLTDRGHRSGELPVNWAFRLPTEAQWEYACRAGSVGATAFGDTLRVEHASFGNIPERADRAGHRRGARAAASYPANAWGIHDMHGNVWEWCRDYYHSRLPGGIDPDLHDVKGVPNRDGSYSRVRRGGAWIEPEWACRSACRLRYEPPRRSDHIGFRVVAVEAPSTAR